MGEAKGTLRDDKGDRSNGFRVKVWEKIFYVIFFIYYFPFSKQYKNKGWKGGGGLWGAIECFMKTIGQQMDGGVMKMFLKMKSEWWEGGEERGKIVKVQWK
jgi:hypothetical protein